MAGPPLCNSNCCSAKDKKYLKISLAILFIHTIFISPIPKKIILGGYLIEAGDFNSDLWRARDMLQNQYGFKMDQVITSGIGTEANPTKVYVVMTK